MGPTSALVLFAVIWFMVFFIVLPLRLTTQGEDGEIVPGTHASAPADAQIKRKAKITTIWAVGLWIVIAGTILSGLITVRDLDWFDRMATPEVSQQ
jgi:predicted secreted protein